MKTLSRGGLFLPQSHIIRAAVAVPAVSDNRELVEEFLSWKRSYTRWAYDRYRVWVTRFQDFVDCPPEEIRSEHYVRFCDSIRDRHAPKTIQYALNIVHNYLRFFHEQGRLRFPLYFVRVPKARAESHHCLTQPEHEAIIKALERRKGIVGMRDEALLWLLYDTGMRIGELLGLNVGDIGSERTARIPTEKTVTERYVFWTDRTQRAIDRYLRERQAEEGCVRPLEPYAPLFVGSDGRENRLSARTVQRRLRESCREAGIGAKVCPHSFRHAFIHRMARKGVPDSVTSVLVGHTTPMTVAHYTRLNADEQRSYFEAGQLAAAR